ncbi:hypothetical protein H5410_008577 [Solanum commersonii]|uniref:Uncharacterized protein n=1 Tax=Solanum commersonii TaxID=4109 RepID=A0A9J6AH67_SOLCO|nr:hypothetical protein H5410_008577 [Solanum commersonii]
MGNQILVAANIASISGLNTDHPMYKKFLDFMQSKQGKDKESTEIFDQNDKKEVILLIEHKIDNTSEGFSCLQRTFYTKFWNKLIQKNLEGKIYGQEIIDLINTTMDKYQNTERSKSQKASDEERNNIQIRSHSHIYGESKKRFNKNLDIDIRDDISMASATHTNDNEESCMAGEAWSANSNEEIDIDTLLQGLQD